MLHNVLYTLLLSFTFSISVLAEENVLPYKTNVDIDGINNEWSSPLPKYDKSTCINYEVANDERNIYFIVRIADEATLRQVIQNGFEIWINKDGKKKKETGVAFPLSMNKKTKISNSEQLEQNPSSERGTSEGMETAPNTQHQPFIHSNELILTGFLLNNGKQPIKGCPVQASASLDNSNCLIYELAIPFNTFYKESLDKTDIHVQFCIGFIVRGVDSSSKGGGFGSMESGFGGMGGRHSGMGGRSGGMGGRHGGMSEAHAPGTSIESEKAFWFKTYLSVQKTTGSEKQ